MNIAELLAEPCDGVIEPRGCTASVVRLPALVAQHDEHPLDPARAMLQSRPLELCTERRRWVERGG